MPLDETRRLANFSANRSTVSARTGSAPQKATSQLRRSSDPSSSGWTFRAQTSYAKFGAPLVVARNFEMA